MALDADRLTAAIIDIWYGTDGVAAGFAPGMSKEEVSKFIKPQIQAIAQEVIKELVQNAVVDSGKIT